MQFSTQMKLLFLFILIFTVSCSPSSQKVFKEKGLVTGQPGMNIFNANLPGETMILKRPFNGAPPLVPHNTDEFTVSKDENECFDCHFDALEVEEGHIATKIPPSHYINEFSKEQTNDRVVGIRHLCLQCHVPQSESEPPATQMNK